MKKIGIEKNTRDILMFFILWPIFIGFGIMIDLPPDSGGIFIGIGVVLGFILDKVTVNKID